jgi:putative tricarboxylic transport membrane protein
VRDPVTVYTVFLGLFVGTGLLWALGIVTTNIWARMISLPAPIIGVAIIILCAVGAYAGRGTMFDVGVLMVFGFIGLAVRRFGYSAPALVLGAILGPIIERNLRLSLILSNNNPVTFVTHPISLVLLLGAVGIMVIALLTKRSQRRAVKQDPDAADEDMGHPEFPPLEPVPSSAETLADHESVEVPVGAGSRHAFADGSNNADSSTQP